MIHILTLLSQSLGGSGATSSMDWSGAALVSAEKSDPLPGVKFTGLQISLSSHLPSR